MTGFDRWLTAVVGVSVIWLFPATPLSAQTRVDPGTFLRTQLGFDDGEMERVTRGEAVTILIDGDDDAEVATFSAFRVGVGATGVMGRLRSAEAQLPGEGQRAVVSTIGRLHESWTSTGDNGEAGAPQLGPYGFSQGRPRLRNGLCGAEYRHPVADVAERVKR